MSNLSLLSCLTGLSQPVEPQVSPHFKISQRSVTPLDSYCTTRKKSKTHERLPGVEIQSLGDWDSHGIQKVCTLNMGIQGTKKVTEGLYCGKLEIMFEI